MITFKETAVRWRRPGFRLAPATLSPLGSDPLGEDLVAQSVFVGLQPRAQVLSEVDLRPGAHVLDYGCGSGVLAIAALKLGCKQAHAMDIDVQAVTATRENAAQNDVQDRLMVSASADDIDGEFDVVVANILAGPLVELAASISERVKPGGQLALSGILSEQAAEVMEAYAQWVEFDEPEFRQQDGQTWVRLTGRRRHD